jgi:mRNA interferase MazF
MSPGDIALSAVPQADGTAKQRPVLLLTQLPGFGDWLVCGVSTQLRQEVVGFDEPMLASDDDFAASGLKAPSLIRLGFLAVIPVQRIAAPIGAIDRSRLERLLRRLSDLLRPVTE